MNDTYRYRTGGYPLDRMVEDPSSVYQIWYTMIED